MNFFRGWWGRASRKLDKPTTKRPARGLRFEPLESRWTPASWTDFGALVASDSYEQNDTFSAASNLGTISGSRTISGLTMDDSSDWFKFTTTAAGQSTSNLSIAFNHAQGDLDVRLYNSAGTRIGISQGVTNTERISLANLAAGTYYVRVYGYRGDTSPQYSLTINAPGATTTTQAPGVDLYGATLTAPDQANWGQAITVQAAVRNNGTARSGAFAVEWWLSSDSTWSADDIILTDLNGVGNRIVAGLSAGTNSSTMSVTLSLPPSLPAGWDASSVHLVMRTDAGNLVAETNENNNTGQRGLGRDFESLSMTTAAAGQFQITLNISGMTASQRAIFQSAADRWAEVIVGDLPNATYNGMAVDDVLIAARGVSIDGSGGVLGQAGPTRVRSGSYLPIHGIMEFDTADLAQLEAEGSLFHVILHEMGHVLGIGTIWDNLGLVSGSGTRNPIFTGAQATATYNALFGTAAAGVPLENGGGEGTAEGHWRESVFGEELMTGYLDAGINPLSRITVASLADLGYRVNMAAADSFTR